MCEAQPNRRLSSFAVAPETRLNDVPLYGVECRHGKRWSRRACRHWQHQFLGRLTGDRAVGAPAPNRFMSCHGKPLCSIEQYAHELTCNHPGMARGKSKTSPLNVKFGKRLGALRQERGWTYTYMSEHSGVATTFLHGLEHGTKEPCLNTLDVLAKSFDMTMSELLKGI